jgi:fructose-specific phosphotransferase system IIA component
MSNLVSTLLSPECVSLELQGKRKPEIIEELVYLLANGDKVADPRRLADEVAHREKLASTGIGSGIAIPHALSATVTETAMAFGLKLDGVRFDAVDNQPVSIFFLLVGPEGSQAEHLRVLSKLARYLHDRTFCQSLLDATTPQAIVHAIERKESSDP